jgi:hypothetical protein
VVCFIKILQFVKKLLGEIEAVLAPPPTPKISNEIFLLISATWELHTNSILSVLFVFFSFVQYQFRLLNSIVLLPNSTPVMYSFYVLAHLFVFYKRLILDQSFY